MDASNQIILHDRKYDRADLQGQIDECRRRDWRRQRWTQRDTLVHRSMGMTMPYVGQPYDTAEFKVLPGGWKLTQCEICSRDLCESTDPEHSIGYTDGRRWLCSECYTLLIHRK